MQVPYFFGNETSTLDDDLGGSIHIFYCSQTYEL